MPSSINDEIIKYADGILSHNRFNIPLSRLQLLYFSKEPHPENQLCNSMGTFSFRISMRLGGRPYDEENVKLFIQENEFLRDKSQEEIMDFIEKNIEIKVNDYTLEESEPSMIFLDLPIKESEALGKKIKFQPRVSYLLLSPHQRWAFFKMLEDLTKAAETDLVLIYAYCLERRLLEKENYINALSELVTLYSFNKSSFKEDYMIKILLFVYMRWGDNYALLLLVEELKKHPINQISILPLFYLKKPLYAKEMFPLINQLSYINRRYLKSETGKYFQVLELIMEEEYKGLGFHFYNLFEIEEAPSLCFNPFLNYSPQIVEEIKDVKIHDVTRHYFMIEELKRIHSLVHKKIREINRKTRKPKSKSQPSV